MGRNMEGRRHHQTTLSEQLVRASRLSFSLYDWACKSHQLMTTYGYMHAGMYLLFLCDGFPMTIMRVSNGCFAMTVCLAVSIRRACVVCRERLCRLVARVQAGGD